MNDIKYKEINVQLEIIGGVIIITIVYNCYRSVISERRLPT